MNLSFKFPTEDLFAKRRVQASVEVAPRLRVLAHSINKSCEPLGNDDIANVYTHKTSVQTWKKNLFLCSWI